MEDVTNTGSAPLPAPSGEPKYIALGLGTQNYTCNSTSGTYTATGALAQLFDATYYLKANKDEVATLSQTYLDLYIALPCSKSPSACVEADSQCANQANVQFQGGPLAPFGEQYFTSNGTPTWDLYGAALHPFLYAKKVGDVKAKNASDVDWLFLESNGSPDNKIISSVYRVETVGGVAPQACSGIHSITVPYAAEYWMYV